MSNVRTRDYDGPRSLDPACADDYTPEWKVTCDSCGEASEVIGGRPDRCPECAETDLDALTIREAV